MVMGEGTGVGELMLNGHRGSVWEKEKVLEMNNGDGHPPMWMYLMSLNVHLKGMKMVNFMPCIFY